MLLQPGCSLQEAVEQIHEAGMQLPALVKPRTTLARTDASRTTRTNNISDSMDCEDAQAVSSVAGANTAAQAAPVRATALVTSTVPGPDSAILGTEARDISGLSFVSATPEPRGQSDHPSASNSSVPDSISSTEAAVMAAQQPPSIDTHVMGVVYNQDGLQEMLTGKVPGLQPPVVLQQYIPHGTTLYKVSLPSMYPSWLCVAYVAYDWACNHFIGRSKPTGGSGLAVQVV